MSPYRGFDPATSAVIVARLLERDGPTCRLCLWPLNPAITNPRYPSFISIDHIVPLGAGGDFGDVGHIENLQLAHALCNGLRVRYGEDAPKWFAAELQRALDAWPKPSRRQRKAAKKRG